MRIDPNNWMKQVVLLNYDLVNTLLLIDLSQKLKCVLTGLLLCHNHAALYLDWFHRAFMVDHAQPRSPALEFLNPCFKSFPTMPLTSFQALSRHILNFGKVRYRPQSRLVSGEPGLKSTLVAGFRVISF